MEVTFFRHESDSLFWSPPFLRLASTLVAAVAFSGRRNSLLQSLYWAAASAASILAAMNGEGWTERQVREL